jgi:nucleotide-binding universal stress UspA family protein
MTIRKILVPLAGSVSDGTPLATALLAATRFRAHVVGVHVRADSRDVAPLAGEGLSGAMIEEMMSAADRKGVERSDAVRAMFGRVVAEHGIRIVLPVPGQDEPTASFAAPVGREEDLVARLARLADLTVVSHPATAGGPSSDALHAVLFDSGRPVLIAPKACPRAIGTRVCVAWNGTAEASAAIMGLMPWFNGVRAVQVLHASEYQRRGPPACDVIDYLALHGVRADLVPFRPVNREVGAGLLAAALEFGADLLCMGAYSHSRLRQLVLGGVTRHVLEHASLPVLMSR